jgi:PAS domain S-box-containing protein
VRVSTAGADEISKLAVAINGMLEELQRSEAKYRELVQNANSIIMRRNVNGEITFFNEFAQQFFGYGEQEILGKNMVGTIVPAADSSGRDLAAMVRDIGANPERYATNVNENMRRSGERVWVAWTNRAIRNAEGRVVEVLCVGNDITARKEVENQLMSAKVELERSNAELKQFACIVSHDLQEPLRTIGSYVQLLARRYKGKLDSDADDFIGYTVDGVQRMGRLIRDLLAYARVDAQAAEIRPVDCSKLLENTLTGLKTAVESKNARIIHDPLPTVVADPLQLRQVFQNLIANSLKFCGEDQPRIHVSARHRDTEWEFSVRDNGIGINPDFSEQVFVVFQRLHTKEEYPGTGIGLAICKRIIERHGGRIWVESQRGKGSTFFFTIPARAEK